jgi:aspartyl aminopeptidase
MIQDFLKFLKSSPTVYHAAEEVIARLQRAGFTELKEKEKWTIVPGHGYYVVRDESLVTAFRAPLELPKKAILIATHLDSPGLALKPNPETSCQDIGQLNTEIYGSPLLHTWLDRDLMIAGKITYLSSKDRVESQTVLIDDHPVIIPNLALHLDRSTADKGLMIQKQDHLKAIFSLHAEKHSLEKILHRIFEYKKLMSFDLSLVPIQEPACIGAHEEMIAAHRLDNLSSAYAACVAICYAKPAPTTLPISFFWDHEEIGSISSRGADSVFASELIQRIAIALKMEAEEIFRMKASSLCISADLAHGFLPNFSEKFDPQNTPFLGEGVVIKFNANQRYATNHTTAARILNLSEKYNIPIQKFASRSDMSTGSTVGSMMAAMTGIPTVDLGISSFAMHSIRETISSSDLKSLCNLLQKALEIPDESL